MDMEKILVLLSTYNGEKYISEQIESILSQQGVNVYILIRDDGSKDRTIEIVKGYERKCCNITFVEGDNVGFVNSFTQLLKIGLKKYKETNFFAFADQDDIWFPDKLKKSCEALSNKDMAKPLLFMCNSQMVNSLLDELGLFVACDLSNINRGAALIHPVTQGCAMVFNRRAGELYVSHQPEKSWHDRWLFLICFFLGEIFYYQQPLFYYRIHDNNALAQVKISIIEYVKIQCLKFFTSPLHLLMAKEFYENFRNSIIESDKELFRIYFSYRYNLFSKLEILMKKEFEYPLKRQRILYVLKVLLGRL